MTDTRRTAAQEIARIRAVVDRMPFPDIVKGYDVELGEFDGEPAMWIVFQTDGQRPHDKAGVVMRGDTLRQLKESVHRRLRDEVGDRYPYYRFAVPELAPQDKP